MAIREPTFITATTSAKAVKIPAQYRNQNIPVPVGVIVEDGVSSFEYAEKEAGPFATWPTSDAGPTIPFGFATPDSDGTLFWVKVASGTLSLVIQTSENNNRGR